MVLTQLRAQARTEGKAPAVDVLALGAPIVNSGASLRLSGVDKTRELLLREV